MINKVKAGWNVLKAGQMVANPVAWKKGQITTGHLIAVLSSIVVLSKVLGYELPISETQQAAVATLVLWIFSLFNQYATVASTDKLGLSPKPEEFKYKLSVEGASKATSSEVYHNSKPLGQYPPTPDKEELQTGLGGHDEQRAKDSFIG